MASPNEDSPLPKDSEESSVYKSGACPVAKNAEDVAVAGSIIVEFAAGCAGAFAKGMQAFSEKLEAKREQSPKDRFVDATTEGTVKVLSELVDVVRRHRDRVITPGKSG